MQYSSRLRRNFNDYFGGKTTQDQEKDNSNEKDDESDIVIFNNRDYPNNGKTKNSAFLVPIDVS